MKNHYLVIAQYQFYNELKEDFYALGTGGRYTPGQKQVVFDLVKQYGVRATSRILSLPRRTLQRWIQQEGIYVKRCPDWVYYWADKRKRRREFWARRGYF
jgi:transposase-like protein